MILENALWHPRVGFPRSRWKRLNTEVHIRGKRLAKILLAGVAVLGMVLRARALGLADLVSADNLGVLQEYIEGFGALGPLVYVAAYAAATVAFLPATLFTPLAGLAFGPVWGSVYAFVGATSGLTLAFLVARYAARGLVRTWIERDERLQRIDRGVEDQGWRMLVITRLVPVFPFNLQNYAYGLTRVGFATYVLVSAVCSLPGLLVYTFAGGSLAVAGEDPTLTFVLLGAAAVLFVLLSFVPGWLRRRYCAGPGLDEGPSRKERR
jgi:uncharacterized membrane protein YdjX (TVP38/TMEM64 family)